MSRREIDVEAARQAGRASRAARGFPAVIDDPALYRRLGYLIQRAEQTTSNVVVLRADQSTDIEHTGGDAA